MALNFGGAGVASAVRIDEERCTTCGLCVRICKGDPQTLQAGSLDIDQTHYWRISNFANQIQTKF